LASKSGVLPPSLFIRGVDLGENREPEDFGGFADVFRATYKGMEVALKRLRMRAKDDVRLHQVRARCRSLISSYTDSSFVLEAILSRSFSLATASAPKYPSFLRN
jgi:hypothetical protein